MATPFATSKASCGNSTTPETTGSGRARGKRPEMEINFNAPQKNGIFLFEKNTIFGLYPHSFFYVDIGVRFFLIENPPSKIDPYGIHFFIKIETMIGMNIPIIV